MHTFPAVPLNSISPELPLLKDRAESTSTHPVRPPGVIVLKFQLPRPASLNPKELSFPGAPTNKVLAVVMPQNPMFPEALLVIIGPLCVGSVKRSKAVPTIPAHVSVPLEPRVKKDVALAPVKTLIGAE
jgi:hypothetical protein